MNLKLSLETAPLTRIRRILCSELVHWLLTTYHIQPLEPFQKESPWLTTSRRQETTVLSVAFGINDIRVQPCPKDIIPAHSSSPSRRSHTQASKGGAGPWHPGLSLEFEVTEPEGYKQNRKMPARSPCRLNFRVSFWHVTYWKYSKWVSRAGVPTPLTLWTQDVTFTRNLQKLLNMEHLTQNETENQGIKNRAKTKNTENQKGQEKTKIS